MRVLVSLRIALGRIVAFQAVVRPGAVRFLGRGSLFVSPDDPRGMHVRRLWGVTQPNVAAAWLAAMSALRPNLAIDVGANYGELLMLARYRRGQQCLAVEANGDVADVLEQSIRSHRSRDRIRLARCAATDGGARRTTFFVDPEWSGTSSLAPHAGGVAQAVDALSLDELTAARLGTRPQRLLMKVDVEGAEVDVIKGATGLVAGVTCMALIIECNGEALRSSGSSPDALLAELSALGDVYRLTSNGLLRAAAGVEEASKIDLVVFRGTKAQLLRMRLLCFLRAVCGG